MRIVMTRVKPSWLSSTARVVSLFSEFVRYYRFTGVDKTYNPVSKTMTPGTRILTATIKPLRAASKAARTVARAGSRMNGNLKRRLTMTFFPLYEKK